MQAATPRSKTAKYAPYMPSADLIKTGKIDAIFAADISVQHG